MICHLLPCLLVVFVATSLFYLLALDGHFSLFNVGPLGIASITAWNRRRDCRCRVSVTVVWAYGRGARTCRRQCNGGRVVREVCGGRGREVGALYGWVFL